MQKAPRGLTNHHMIPRSRGGTDDEQNIKLVTRTVHEAWHALFKNMKPNEVVALLLSDQFQFDPENGLWKAWKIVFGPLTGRIEAARMVMDEWTPQ